MRDKKLREALVNLGIIEIKEKYTQIEHGSHSIKNTEVNLGKLLRRIK